VPTTAILLTGNSYNIDASLRLIASEAVKHRIGDRAGLTLEPERWVDYQQAAAIEAARIGGLAQIKFNRNDIADQGRFDIGKKVSHRGKVLDWIPGRENTPREPPVSAPQPIGKRRELIASFKWWVDQDKPSLLLKGKQPFQRFPP
jgi:hypothetical protein